MRKTQNQLINDLAGNLENNLKNRKKKPVLFLGAGCSVSAGLPDLEKLCKELAVKSLSDLTADRLKLSVCKIHEILIKPNDTFAYEMLACLISKDYFDTVLTTNWDFLLENSLSHFLPPEQYRVYVRESESDDDRIAEALARETPRVKVIKLHGDTLGKIIIRPEDLLAFKQQLRDELRKKLHNNQLWIIGYGLRELRFYGLIEDCYPIVVRPIQIKDNELKQMGSGALQICGEDGEFDKFIECLCFELLGKKYRSMTMDTEHRDRCISSVLPLEHCRHEIDTICGKIKDRVQLSNIDDERIEELVKRMIESIKNQFCQIEGADKVCLIFIRDPYAPGGTEIERLIVAKNNLQEKTTGMEFQSVEILNRYEGKRKVIRWNPHDRENDLSKFSTVVLVDSVSFTGNTLELAREYLSQEGNRAKEQFCAALLVLPNEAKENLGKDPWRAIISPNPGYSGFEITFPWGWTTATLPIIRKKQLVDNFIPSDIFSFIPKPWGDQLTFCSNERVSVSLLAFNRGQRTSTHFHILRNEIFYVIDNRVRIRIWHHSIELRKHQSICIPAGVPHSLIALDQPCRVLEIATGQHDQKRDIVRLVDIYGREPSADGSHDGLK